VTTSVCIPTIPPRATLLRRALGSVYQQTLPADEIVVVPDDEFLPQHLELLVQHQSQTGADLVYPWFEIAGGTFDPLGWEGRPFDPVALRQANYIPVTVLVRRQLLLDAGGFRNRSDGIGGATWEDWAAWLALLDQGATFSHLPSRTWRWHHHGEHTRGRADGW
jgi:hypothetical protein